MKKLIAFIVLSVLSTGFVFSQGVAIVNVDSASNSFTAFQLLKSTTTVSINNQIATTTTAQLFKNTTADTTGFKYAIPLPETAAATKIRWSHHNQWFTASMISSPQDTTFSDTTGTTAYMPAELDTFLGETPLYYPVNIMVPPGESITIELTYVELLPYYYNHVQFIYPGRYDLIQPAIDTVLFDVSIQSYRNIDSLLPATYNGWANTLNGTTATTSLALYNTPFADNLQFDYVLEPDTLGFFSFSTFYPDSIEKCDTTNGFFTFIVEPNSADSSAVIQKDFILIIDHSGSMSGIKMAQANEAADFIVNHLNPGDRFNLVKFDTDVESVFTGLTPYTIASKNTAINYIANIQAEGSTNISGAFDVGVPMFAGPPDNRAKIIIFFTDGMPSAGITNENQLVSHVTSLISTTNPNINLHVFGIGNDVNNPLLATMAAQNNGSYAALANNNVADAISDFYTTIQSPVLLNTAIAFSPNAVTEVYPNPLPNLYKGQQLIVSGRYSVAGPIDITLSGVAFGNPVSYQYTMNLVDSTVEENNFLPKIWTKGKIDYLMNQYYLNQSNQTVADAIKDEIIFLSICRGVISPFTSFNGDTGGGWTTGIEETPTNEAVESIKIYPNPANALVYIAVPKTLWGASKAMVSLYSMEGKLIAQFYAPVSNDGKIELDIQKLNLNPGLYITTVDVKGNTFRGKLTVY
jgi:Ca-activated chloride channel family protein